ncbi:20497_t:CDS:2, partial [Entrophospora sp. SA101]
MYATLAICDRFSVGSICGIREKLSGVDNTVPEQAPAQPEIKSPIIEEIRNKHNGGLFIGEVLKSFKKPIDIIKQSIHSRKGKEKEIIPESPAESSSRAQRREEARAQKKAEKKKPTKAPEKEIIFREIELSEWLKKRKIIALHRVIIPEDNEVKHDELFIASRKCQRENQECFKIRAIKEKRIQFSILLQATTETTRIEMGEDDVTYIRKESEDHPYKTTMDYILNESDINDRLYIDVQVAQYNIVRGGNYIKTPKKLANTKGTINPDNSKTNDNECLKHAISAFNAHRISEKKVLRNHQKYCYGHTDAPQFTELPEKSKNDNGK